MFLPIRCQCCEVQKVLVHERIWIQNNLFCFADLCDDFPTDSSSSPAGLRYRFRHRLHHHVSKHTLELRVTLDPETVVYDEKENSQGKEKDRSDQLDKPIRIRRQD